MLAGAASAQSSDPPKPAAPADIEVTGRTPAERRAFVQSLTDAYYGQQLTRWNDPICPATVGLPEAYGRFLIRRVQSIASELDIPLDHGNCQPNILILSVPQTDDYVARLVSRHPALGRNWGQALPPRHQLDTLRAPRAVRWFHASVTTDGSIGGNGAPATAGTTAYASRLKLATRESATLAVILLDPDHIVGATWDELADYIAMVGLSRPRLDADFSHAPSILSLYRNTSLSTNAPEGLTREDRAFLKALYASDATRTAEGQRQNIVSRLPR
ncbi:hypothetical protein [Sphingomonas nostoxanthinifaciens]|uniref:hypothetical protein n=1 Tax=Sphingomonas nostoxanthinifaciens TaxID=2872652 RepID=UPI001CC1D94C|nr:hypothetical protein [Sphingomonas nostoxanthinifaciens]UAK22945.1 hypothetical protein K8P63_10905 [Sphingomonas nostoxanthinifaciens]